MTEIPTAPDRDDTAQTLRLLREEVALFLRDLPVPPSRVSVRAGSFRLEADWPGERPAEGRGAPESAASPAPVAAAGAAGTAPPEAAAGTAATAAEAGEEHKETAPMVGTFYRAPEPGVRPFVEVGDRVDVGQTIGIIEAMKLMNHVPSDRAGTVTEIHVEDGRPVEFEQPLITVSVAE